MNKRPNLIFRSVHFAQFNTKVSWANTGAHVLVFLLLAVTVLLCMVFQTEAIRNGVVVTALEITFIVLLLLTKLLQDSQRVYIFYRFFRNCFYPKNLSVPAKR